MTRVLEKRFRVGPAPNQSAEPLRLRERDALAALHRVVVPADLCKHRVAQTKSLVPKLSHIFRVGRIFGRVDAANCFQKTERDAGVDCRSHIRGGSESGERRNIKKPDARCPIPDTRYPLPDYDLRTWPLTRDGVVAAAIIGIVCAIAGWAWVLVLMAFFVSGTVLTRFGQPRKLAKTEGIAAKRGGRDAWQVLANGGVFGAAAIGSIMAPSAAWTVLGAAAIATSAADTWATEIGTLSSDMARSILTWREVPPGTSGGITLTGTAAALAGAGLIAAFAGIAGWPARAAYAAILGGFAGSTIDSLLGAGFQAKRWCDQCGMETERTIHVCGTRTTPAGGITWLDNDAVNAISSLAGAATGALCLL